MKRKNNFVFGSVPMIRASRSKFDLSYTHKTSGNVGKLYPFMCQEVYPGDTFKVKSTILARLNSAYLRPVMDNLFLDQYFFFVPSRLVFDKFAQVFGENKESPWAVVNTPSVPTFQNNEATGNVANHDNVCAYLYLPVGEDLKENIKDVSLLPARAFALIYDEWFRDENNVQPMNIQKGDAVASEKLNNDAWSPSNYLGKCPSVAKFHDYFTSCLPSPQKGNPVEIGAAVVPERLLPVAGTPIFTGYNSDGHKGTSSFMPSKATQVELLKKMGLSDSYVGTSAENSIQFSSAYGSWSPVTKGNFVVRSASTTANGSTGVSGESVGSADSVYPFNLAAYDPGLSLSATTVNDLRLAFQTQKMLEKDARGDRGCSSC